MNEAGEKYKEGLQAAQQPYADTGGQVAATHVKRARKIDSVTKVIAGWKVGAGQHGALAHLNEFGYTRWGRTYSPAGSGLIRDYIDSSEADYVEDVRRGLMELLP